MDYQSFAKELNIVGKVLSVTRKRNGEAYSPIKEGCALRSLNYAFDGETIVLSVDNVHCFGGKLGFGFTSEMNIPGGYGHFVSYGAGEGFPPGMRLKRNPEIAEQGRANNPKNVMDGYSLIEIKPFQEIDEPDLVTTLVNPDQLSALNMLFHFGRVGNDITFFPAGSGCSSIFLLPLAELRNSEPRAVIGNADITVRGYFKADTLFFTVSGKAFKEMLQYAGESFLITPAWDKLKKRI